VDFFRLQPSSIPGAGVGVFATADVPAGTPLPGLFAADDVRFLSPAEFAALDLPAAFKDHYPVHFPDGVYLPVDPNRMSAGWYLNHSPTPNLAHDPEYVYFTLRDVRAGEELLIDYDQI
jgi:hypothetical protein